MNKMKTPEEAGIEIRIASEADLPGVEAFLSRTDIDALFTPPLSDPARGISIADRVSKKFAEGVWIVSVHQDKVVGCMAVVPTKIPVDVPPPDTSIEGGVSEGVSFAEWPVESLKELSTVVTDRALRDELHVKGVGAELLEQAKQWVAAEGRGAWGFITDSWVGGDMGGFVHAMNAKAYEQRNIARGDTEVRPPLNTLARLYSDPSKRGVDGPPTVVYGIPITEADWKFFEGKQSEIAHLQEVYDATERQIAQTKQ